MAVNPKLNAMVGWIKTPCIIASVLVLYHCTGPSEHSIKKAGWLIGTWENTTQKGTTYETWAKTNESELSGKSYMLEEKDTIVLETVRLVEEQNNLYYIPTVKNQNNGLPVRFALKTISDSEFVFENSQHDFPQIITYRKINPDSLIAEISGTVNSQQRHVAFPMKRTN